MILDTLTLTICGILVFMVIITPIINIFFRCIRLHKLYDENDAPLDNNSERPGLSIVIVAQNNEIELQQNLPSIFNQEYEPGFEVIIVCSGIEDDTESVIRNMKKVHPNLYTTFIPDSSRYMSRMKLAVTLGVKAAKNEWIILLGSDCKPVSSQWLNTLSNHCSKHTDVVLGYANYDNDAKKYHIFNRIHSMLYSLRVASSGTAYRSTGGNVAFRKSVFMKHNGFLGNLKYERGEFDFIVNEYANENNTDISIEPEARLSINSPSNKDWLNQHLYYMETRRHLSRSFMQRLKYNTDMLTMHLNYLIQIAALVYFAIESNWIGLGLSVFTLIYTIIIRSVIAISVTKRFNEDIKFFMIPIFEMRLIWTQLYVKLKYKMADKSGFIRK